MKKTISFIAALLMVISCLAVTSFAQQPALEDLADYGQLSLDMYEYVTEPTIDGVIDSSEYGEAVASFTMNSEGNYYTSLNHGSYYRGEIPTDAFPTRIDCYATYDKGYLYIAVVSYDPDHFFRKEWHGDFLEFRAMFPKSTYSNTNKENDATIYRLGLCHEDQYLAETDVYAEESAVIRDDELGTTTYEFKMDLWQIPGMLPNSTKLLCSFGLIFGDSQYSTDGNYGPSWVAPGSVDDIGYFRSFGSIDRSVCGSCFVFNVLNFKGWNPANGPKPGETTSTPETTPAPETNQVTEPVSTDSTSTGDAQGNTSEDKDNSRLIVTIVVILVAIAVVVATVLLCVKKRKK